MGRNVALIVAAGSGSRVGGEVPKQYRKLAGKALLAHAIDHLVHPRIDSVHVVIGKDQEAAYFEAIGDRALPSPVIGGATRRESVANGLAALGEADVVLIHDAARPFLPGNVIDRLLDSLRRHEGAVPALPVVDTLSTRSGEAVDREALVRVQTPQAFRLDAIRAAHATWSGDAATDDAQVARAAGLDVVLVDGDPALEKLTWGADFDRVEAARLVPRTGTGFDVHAFGSGDHVWLGGVRIAHDHGLRGHSDADVALHALTDALLGAIAAGDIGDHFPPSDPRWKDAPSTLFLDHARDLVAAAGGRIVHADITIICEAPRVGPHRDAMRQLIADRLRLSLARISVKATTTERLGFTGRGEGIAAQAVATVMLPETE